MRDPDNHWDLFSALYKKELNSSPAVSQFLATIKSYPVVTLLYASKSPDHNHAMLLKEFLGRKAQGRDRFLNVPTMRFIPKFG